MQIGDEKVVERVFDDTMERVWEEAKLRDLMVLCYMWNSGALPQYRSFAELLGSFCRYDNQVRRMGEQDFFALEKQVVETICNSPQGSYFGACEDGEESVT
jgi:hypothetical protein